MVIYECCPEPYIDITATITLRSQQGRNGVILRGGAQVYIKGKIGTKMGGTGGPSLGKFLKMKPDLKHLNGIFYIFAHGLSNP